MTQPRQPLENSTRKKKKPAAKAGRPRVYVEPEETKPRLYFDLDGVVADFDRACQLSGIPPNEFKLLPGTYFSLPPYPGAIKALERLNAAGCDIWIATKIPTANPGAASEKLHWIQQYLPWLMRKVIITPDKGTLGTSNDYLIDDRPHKANCEDFAGTLLHFGPGKAIPDWDTLLAYLNDTLHLDLETDLRNSSTFG